MELSIRFSAQGEVPSHKRVPGTRLKRSQAASPFESHWNSGETSNTEGTSVQSLDLVLRHDRGIEKKQNVYVCARGPVASISNL